MEDRKQHVDEDEDQDYYSPTDCEREPGESDEDYQERIEDLESYFYD